MRIGIICKFPVYSAQQLHTPNQIEVRIEDFKKTSLRAWMPSRVEKAVDSDKIEIWFADEPRIGQKNKLTRRWAKRSIQPVAAMRSRVN